MGILGNPTRKRRWVSPGHDNDPRQLLTRYLSYNQGYTVVIWDDDSVTPHPGTVSFGIRDLSRARDGSGYGGKAVFLGGHTWDQITTSETTLLRAAGYTVVDN